MSEQIERVSRQLLLPGWSLATQQRLEATIATTDGNYGLAALYLAGAGIRHHELSGPLASAWATRITRLLPDATTVLHTAPQHALMLSSTDRRPLLTLSIAAIADGVEVAATGGTIWRVKCSGLPGAGDGDPLFIGSALATIALRWFSQQR